MDNYCLTQLGNSSQGTNWMWCAKLLAVTCPKSTTPMLHFAPHRSHTNTQFASHHFLCLHASSVLVALYLSNHLKYLTNQYSEVSIDNLWFSWNVMILITGVCTQGHWLTCTLKLWLLEAVSLRSMLVPMARSSRARSWREEGWFISYFQSTLHTHTATVPIFQYWHTAHACSNHQLVYLPNSWSLLLHNPKDARVE